MPGAYDAVYHHLRGELVATGPMLAVVEAAGVGFELSVPLSTLDALRGQGEVLVYTRLLVREDDLRLFGFATREERRLFDLVLGVTGVGPSIALAALSALSPGELAGSIAGGDVRAIQRIKGVGKRLAERLVVELRDRVSAADAAAAPTGARRAPEDSGDAVSDAVSGLVVLGYTQKEAEDRVLAARERIAGASEAPPTVQDLLRAALR